MTTDPDNLNAGMKQVEVPVTDHETLPDGVPLVASFTDDRNRLSYYHPLLKEIDGVRTPETKFFPVDGSADTYVHTDYRAVTRWMQDLDTMNAFVRGDFSSGKYDGETGSKLESQDPYDIERVILEMYRQLSRAKRALGGRLAVREWVPHDVEVRYYVRDGSILYSAVADGEVPEDAPDEMAQLVADRFDLLAWSVDFIRHEQTGEWYCIDMGLDGLYHDGSQWVAISEHIDKSESPEQWADEMPTVRRFTH